MSEEKLYQGWTNYPTWAVKLWIDNEQGSQEYWRETAERIRDEKKENHEPYLSAEEAAVLALADTLKDEHQENIPEAPGVYGDLLGYSLDHVNWFEIARNMLEDL